MDKWKKFVPAGVAAAAAGVAAAVFSGKKNNDAPKAEQKSAKPAKKAEPKNLATGSYSFVSGYLDARTVEVAVKYDADRYNFSVVEEDFLSFTSDSHVALLKGADFNAQIEYANYYSGDDFAKLGENAKANYSGFAPIANGFRYVEGNSVCVCLPVDEFSYLLISTMLSKGSKLKFAELPAAAEFTAFIEGIEIK